MEDIYCLIGESGMKDFTAWWESCLPAYIIIYCREGEAELKLQFRNYTLRQGMMTIIPPDMYPAVTSRSETFNAFYCLMSRDFAEKALYGIPKDFYEAIYSAPVLPLGNVMDNWIKLMQDISDAHADPYRNDILLHIIYAFSLDYYSKWKLYYNDLPLKDEKNTAEAICMKFYNLILDHVREHHTVAYYADRLCITPNYLAMITRQICNESPKQAIDRQIILEIKYMLHNTIMTAEQIAMRLNFSDTSYMCRFFRRQTGCTLSEYRRRAVRHPAVHCIADYSQNDCRL